MKTIIKVFVTFFISFGFLGNPAFAQTQLELDVTSRYVWRGTDFGNSPSIQPSLSFGFGSITVGGWAAIATNGNPEGSEIDFFLSYDIGNFSLLITDYTFPESPMNKYFDPGSHFVELGLNYAASDRLPFDVFVGVFVLNDSDYSLYSQIGYSIGNVDLFMGFTPYASEMYGTSKAGIIMSGLTLNHEVKITDVFSVNTFASVFANPYSNNGFLLFGVRI